MSLNPNQFRQISPGNPLSEDEARAILRHVRMTSGMDFQSDRVVMPSGLHLPSMDPNVVVEDFGEHGSKVSAYTTVPVENGNLGHIGHDNRMAPGSDRPLSMNLAIHNPVTRGMEWRSVLSTPDRTADLDEYRKQWPVSRASGSKFVSVDHFGEAAADMFRNSEPPADQEREFNSRWIRERGVPSMPFITFHDHDFQHSQRFNPRTGELGPVERNWDDAD
jgi:hypothetical protein